MRFTRLLRFAGNLRFLAMVDICDVFNSNTVSSEDSGFGPTYPALQTIMPGRLGKFAFQIDF